MPQSSRTWWQVAGRQFHTDQLFELALRAVGGHITSAYFQLIDLPISEFLFHCEQWASLQRKETADSDRKVTDLM